MTIQTFYRLALWLPLVVPISVTGWMRAFGLDDPVSNLIKQILLSSLLYETDARDPWTLGLTAIVLVSVALLAALVPALRGTRISPTQALRVQ